MNRSFQERHRHLVTDVALKLQTEGYRTLVVGNQIGTTPDIVAFKDGKVFQVEAETNRHGYEKLLRRADSQYDFALFFTRGRSGQVVKLLDTIEPRRKGTSVEPPTG